MTKKHLYFGEAERLYVVEQMTILEVAGRLKLGEKTIRLWKEEGDWDTKRKQYLTQKQSFHEELYGFSRALMQSIQEDMKNGVKPDSGRLYTLGRILPLIAKVKDYEDVLKTEQAKGGQAEKPGAPDEVIDLVRKFLGETP